MEVTFEIGLLIICLVAGYICGSFDKEKPTSKFEKCTCGDSSKCDTWCIGKENFTNAQKCPIITKVVCVAGTCETTVDECQDCKKISEPKIDCR